MLKELDDNCQFLVENNILLKRINDNNLFWLFTIHLKEKHDWDIKTIRLITSKHNNIFQHLLKFFFYFLVRFVIFSLVNFYCTTIDFQNFDVLQNTNRTTEKLSSRLPLVSLYNVSKTATSVLQVFWSLCTLVFLLPPQTTSAQLT